MTSINSVKKKIAREKRRLLKVEMERNQQRELKRLHKELKTLQKPSYGRFGRSIKAVSSTGKNIGKVALNQALKQAKLIRAQQERDAKKLAKKSSNVKGTKAQKSGFNLFEPIDF